MISEIGYGIRIALKDKITTVSKLCIFAICVSGGTVIYSLLDNMMTIHHRYPNGDKVIAIGYPDSYSSSGISNLSHRAFLKLQDEYSIFQSAVSYTFSTETLRDGQKTEVLSGVWVTPDFFDLLGTEPLLGSRITAENAYETGIKSALISFRLWRRFFNEDPSVVGKVVYFNDRPHRIVGVLDQNFQTPGYTSTYAPDYWAPFRPDDFDEEYLSYGMWKVLAANENDLAISTIRSQIVAHETERGRDPSLTVVGMRDFLLSDELRRALRIVVGAAAFLVLVALVNISFLSLAQGIARKREFALRFALGARYGVVFKSLFWENILLLFGAGILGMILSINLQEYIVSLIPERTGISFGIDIPLFLTIAGICFGFCFLMSLLPSMRLRSQAVFADVKGGTSGILGRRGRKEKALSNLMIYAEISTACLFIFLSGLMLMSHWKRTSVDRGPFADRISLFTIRVDPETYPTREQRVQSFRDVKTELLKLPEVESVAMTGFVVPDEERATFQFVRDTDNPDPEIQYPDQILYRTAASVDYFKTLGIPILRGRVFDMSDLEADQRVLIISKTAADRYWPDEDPIGKRILIRHSTGGWAEIVGVSGDMLSAGGNPQKLPMAWRPLARRPYLSSTYIVRTGNEDLLARERTQRIVWEKDPDISLFGPVKFMSDIHEYQWQESLLSILLTAFEVLILALCILGIYSVVSYNVAQRMAEFAFRVSLGARFSDLLRLLLGRGLVNTLIGLATGLLLGFVASRFVSAYLYETSIYDPTIITITIVLVLVATLCTYLVPAMKVRMASPNAILRSE